MTILKTGKNRIITLMASDLDYGEFGTNGTASSETQTGLIGDVTSTIKTLTITTADKQLTATHVLLSTEGNGETYSEFANLMNGTSTAFNRVVIADLDKTSAEEFQTNTIVTIL